MHDHSSVSWFFITDPIPSPTVSSSLISQSNATTLHRHPYSKDSWVHLGHFEFKSQQSFASLAAITGASYLWIPAVAGASVVSGADVDVFSWIDEDCDVASFVSTPFPWIDVQAILDDLFYWDCRCDRCLSIVPSGSRSYANSDPMRTPSPPSSDDETYAPYEPTESDFSFLDEPYEINGTLL